MLAYLNLYGRIVGGFILAVLVIISPFALPLVLRSGPIVRITTTGVEDVRFGVGEIPWKDVEAISVRHVSGRPMIELWLRDEARYRASLPLSLRALARSGAYRGRSLFLLNFTALTPGFDDAISYISQYVPVRADT
jgi:hypothetical protein